MASKSINWIDRNVPDLSGKTFLVTGANSGLGKETSRLLARRGAHVVMACRNLGKAEQAADDIRKQEPKASLEIRELNLASLANIASFAEGFLADHQRLDVLINNAGVMALPYRTTEDGFEMQFGTNHLGHFALTGRLIRLLLGTEKSRVVTVSSHAHRMGKIRFRDLQWTGGYQRWLAYGQSKLANLLFTLELQRRFEGIGSSCRATAAHPGYAATELALAGPRMEGSSVMEKLVSTANSAVAQDAAMGSLPTLQAATLGNARGGEYFGPGGLLGLKGAPVAAKPSSQARNAKTAQRLWDVSVELTGVAFDELNPSSVRQAG